MPNIKKGFTLIRTSLRENLGLNVKGFTLIELLVVISIIAVITGIALVALGGARAGGRDAQRKGSLEQIRSGLELYRTDCGRYPGNISWGANLTGDGSSTTCAAANVYIQSVPTDPQSTAYTYYYTSSSPNSAYTLCAYLETTGAGAASGCGNCGVGTTTSCNYKVNNP